MSRWYQNIIESLYYMCDARVNRKWHFICLFCLVCIKRVHFFWFSVWRRQPFWAAILNLKVKSRPKIQWIPFFQICKAKVSEIWHFIGLNNPSGSREMTVHVLEYGVWGHYWAAILDLNVKMVSEHSKNLSIGSGIPNLVGKVASFAFFITFGSRDVTFNGFQYGVGSHFGPPFWTWKSRQTQSIMNTILLDLQSQN